MGNSPLNIVICIKTVALKAPDSAGHIPRGAYALNPFDQPALEAALTLKEAYGGRTTALSMGPPWATGALHETLALGIDRAVLLSDPALAGSDTLATSTALAAALEQLKPWDLLIFGSRTADGDTGHVGPQTALRLDLPMVTGAVQITAEGNKLQLVRRADGMVQHFEAAMPAAVGVHPSAWPLREMPLGGIEASYASGVIETVSLEDIQVPAASVGENGSPTRVLSTRPIKREKACTFIEGAAAEQVEGLVRQLKDQGLLE